jgi:hypothetical protein
MLLVSAAPSGLGFVTAIFPGAHAPGYVLSPLRGSIVRRYGKMNAIATPAAISQAAPVRL